MGTHSERSEELWLLALVIASVAVVLIAVLFGLVIAALLRIDRHAARTHAAAKQIAQHTVALWALEQLNRDLVAIRDAARGAQSGGTAGPGTGAMAAAADKIQGWLGSSEQHDDRSS
jgi:hypothetical protein